jgi:diguanylate cyclase
MTYVRGSDFDMLASALHDTAEALPDRDSSAAQSTASPERSRALASADPAQQLGDALVQIDALRARNASLQRSLSVAVHLAFHDELTGLANRRLLLDRFQHAVAHRSSPQTNVALAFVDLDRFKRVNDTLGHTVGDRLLELVARRLESGIREDDTACRFGGDEFVVLLGGVVGRGGAVAALDHINSTLVEPYVLDDTRIAIRASTGLAVHPLDGEDFAQLIQVASRDMTRNKSALVALPREHEGNREALPEDPRSGKGNGQRR